ncbi:MAG: alpha-(1-_3)-arabinofuranosyltransferase family protein [Candidatus Bathyarchaeia archaeon]
MKKVMDTGRLEKLEIVILFLLSLIPLLWWKPGYIIAKGDYFPFSGYFPFWFNLSRTLRTLSDDAHLWSAYNMGNVNAMSSYLLYEILWLFLRSINLSVGLAQIIFQTFFFMGAGFSMYYLSKTVYPQLKLSPLISSIFYMFNFFVLRSRLNPGMAWTYTFLPLLMALLIKIMNLTSQQNNKKTNKIIFYFAIISTISLSFASINPTNVVLTLLSLAILLPYYLIAQKNRIHQLLQQIVKLTIISTLLNMWWIIPILNYYLWSPLQLNSYINVTSWSWTHYRASFLNLFRLNGDWDWRPEYVPYIDSYSNPILIILTFIPFFLAASALLFKTNKSRFNAYVMLIILIFTFLAKGLHEPLSQLNLLLYIYIPYMNMFREPQSKFTMAIMPFLALLIGYAAHHIANIKIKLKHAPLIKTLTVTVCITTFIIASYPLVTNPIETKTEQLPFSSYIKIPDYWKQAADWLNNQPGNYKILITPPDDFYQMPYTWGYYGAEDFLPRLIQKPILTTYYYPYRINPNVTAALEYVGKTITYNKTMEFKVLLDLLNIKYILQRNDVQSNFTGRNILTGRNIIPPEKMQAFFASQPYIRLIQKFGQLDIYEYTNPKPYIYTVNPAILQKATIKIEKIAIQEKTWDFTNPAEFQEWQNFTDQIFKNTTQNQPAIILNYKKESPTKITVTINATQPFILAISEALDQSWTAYINGKTYKPTIIYLCISGFHINQTGLLDVTIEYEPQHWFYIGCAISLTTFFAYAAYLAYSYIRPSSILQKLKRKTHIGI